MSKIKELGEIELSDNEALKKYLDTLLSMCRDLYDETNWAAAILQARLANIKGVKNIVRAKQVSMALQNVADSFKNAGAGTQKTWTVFEQKFAPELSEVSGKKRPPKEEFKIK